VSYAPGAIVYARRVINALSACRGDIGMLFATRPLTR